MFKISNREIIDVVKYHEDNAIIVEKMPLLDSLNQYKVNYFVINFKTGEKEVITKNAYLLKKFGTNYSKISDTIANFVQCDAAILSNRNVLIIFPNGQTGMFDSNGEIKWNKTLTYNEASVSGMAIDGDYFWGFCKDENCVIRYTCDNLKVDLRIGGKDANTFINPNFISSDDNNIYVCCNSSKVRMIDKSNFTVSDLTGTMSGVERFYKFSNYSILCTTDGAYLIDDIK